MIKYFLLYSFAGSKCLSIWTPASSNFIGEKKTKMPKNKKIWVPSKPGTLFLSSHDTIFNTKHNNFPVRRALTTVLQSKISVESLYPHHLLSTSVRLVNIANLKKASTIFWKTDFQHVIKHKIVHCALICNLYIKYAIIFLILIDWQLEGHYIFNPKWEVKWRTALASKKSFHQFDFTCCYYSLNNCKISGAGFYFTSLNWWLDCNAWVPAKRSSCFAETQNTKLPKANVVVNRSN